MLNALYDLKAEGCPFKLTIGITPVLADTLILKHFQVFIEDKIERSCAAVERFHEQGKSHLVYLAGFYRDIYESLHDSFENRFHGDIIGSFKKLQDDGYVEILTSTATHAYLPLVEHDSSIYVQLRTGVDTYKSHFGRPPRAIWLPECGYRPAFYTSKSQKTYKLGIEHFLGDVGIGLFSSEMHMVEVGEPVGKATGAVIGPYSNIPKRYLVPKPKYTEPTMKTTTFLTGCSQAMSLPSARQCWEKQPHRHAGMATAPSSP